MKVVILAGGFGTRLSEYTDIIPKPMVTIAGKPIIWHIMERYAKYGHKDFILALGYKAEVIKEYFLNYSPINSDFTVNLKDGNIKNHNSSSVDWRVTLVQTGLTTLTGGRLARLKHFIGKERFLLTYGDGLSDVNIDKLISFHETHGKLVTVTAVRPPARFGQIELDSHSMVSSFREKPQLDQGWINGGFFVIEPEFINHIHGDKTILEKDPLEKIAQNGELAAFRHEGFWQCMDTKRDRDYLEELATNIKSRPW